jgi:hypothetical protein
MAFIDGVKGITSDLPDINLDKIYPSMQPKVLALAAYADSMDYVIKINSAFRDFMKQDRMYQAYKAGQTDYPVANPIKSKHVGAVTGFAYSLAIDINIYDVNGQKIDSGNHMYGVYGQYWEALGSIGVGGVSYYPVWGGRFSDPIHYEYRDTPPKTALDPNSPYPSQNDTKVGMSADKGSNDEYRSAAAMKEALTKGCPG